MSVRHAISFVSWMLLVNLIVGGVGCQDGTVNPGTSQGDPSLERVNKQGVLVWGADVVEGAPYVYEDPKRPGTFVGFEMDIAQAIAKRMNVNLKLVSKPWDTLIPELQNGSFDMVMNGIEDTDARGHIVLFSEPYYVYSQQLTVRKEINNITQLSDLKGKKVATLSGTAAEDILRSTPGITVKANPDISYSYWDLKEGRVDAVLLDTPIAAITVPSYPTLKNVGQTFGEGAYVITFRQEDHILKAVVDEALQDLKTNGDLKAIYHKWGLLDLHQKKIGIQ